MNKLCLKTSNQEKIKNVLKLYNKSDHNLIMLQLIYERKNGAKLTDLYVKLKNNKFGWNWYEKIKTEVFFEVVSGSLKCSKCGSDKIWNRSQQTRSCDEGQTVFAICTICNNKWIMN